MNYEKELNQKQYEAVTSSAQHLRIVAGAGSGKTRVLTYRIAYLVDMMQVRPWKILAFTFTNKVAAEMKERAGRLVPGIINSKITIKTFHSFAAMFLREEISVLGYPRSFSILDEEDQLKMIKDIAVELGYKKGDAIVKKSLSYIGAMKLKEKYPRDIKVTYERFPDEKTCLKFYEYYEEQKTKMFALDFDDLMLWTINILQLFPDIRTKWQQRYEHILVDEFQDTNDTEYKMLTLISNPATYLYVVGDPDQTIYTWRGANQRIILDLEKRFPDIVTVILDENYRSTQRILDSANKLISNNKERVEKDLFTNNGKGDPITVKSFTSSRLEAEYVAKEIMRLVGTGRYSYNDIVVLYRSNYITLDFEHLLTSSKIPYQVYGGLKFYQRREVKDVLAYFKLIINTKDDLSFERIVNVPRRNIGDASIAKLKNEAENQQLSLYEYVERIDEFNSELPARVQNALKVLIQRINLAREDINKNEEVFSKTLEDMLSEMGYYEALIKEEDGDDRLANVKAIFEDLRHFLKDNPEASFDEYLQNIALVSSQDDMIEGNYITLMTAHTAKGLEYPIVFVVRFNDGVFPNQRSVEDSPYLGMEEERRLAYVAFTRAKEKLYVTYNTGFSYVSKGYNDKSTFIKEAGLSIKTDNTGRQLYSSPFSPYASARQDFDDDDYFGDIPSDRNKIVKNNTPIVQNFDEEEETNGDIEWHVGDLITHKKLGDGVVVELEGDGIIAVEFDEHGRKSLMGNHPSISRRKGN